MVDDKSKTAGQDRSGVAGGQDYEVRHFAEQHEISVQQAEQLIAEHRNDRDALDQAARQMKG